MAAVGELVRCTNGSWMVRPPEHCPRGHRLSPNRALVGHQPCGCGRRGGHMTWACLECAAMVYAADDRGLPSLGWCGFCAVIRFRTLTNPRCPDTRRSLRGSPPLKPCSKSKNLPKFEMCRLGYDFSSAT
jgi:hypothetical protein